MPRRPPTSGYVRIAQAEEDEDEDPTSPYSPSHDDYSHRPDRILSSTAPEYAPIQPGFRREHMHQRIPSSPGETRRPRRRRTNSGVDIKAINARLERWAEEIKERFKIRRVKGKSSEDEHLQIYSSVFQAPEGVRPATKQMLEDEYDGASGGLSKLEFDDLVESVRTAIELGMHPQLISQGSSGSYFARNSGGKVVGVFKPKDEEPYANKNPKWTKWIHRNLFPFAFGRAMLIPNLSYVSEAAAYVLDCQLRTGLVPYTDVVGLSSKSFHYDFWERRSYYRKGRPLPEKLGSFQVFLKGYKGATEFFREHPWPAEQRSGAQTVGLGRKRKRRWGEECRPGTAQEEVESDEGEEEAGGSAGSSRSQSRTGARQKEFWTEQLQQSFREELEKLVILDYIMRNTDRGSDNWMIRIDRATNTASLVVDPPDPSNPDPNGYPRRPDTMSPRASTPSDDEVAIPRLGAIDNSLSWPWKHPDAWRSYPFGWLFLPVSLIGRPFSRKTRDHFLPLLTSKDWWSDTQVKLRRCFEIDADFQEKMFARQMAVMKGQAWNVVETLKETSLGPLELTRRERVLVWDDIVEVPVATRLGRPSEEMRRAATATKARDVGRRVGRVEEMEEEEMDIAAAYASSQPPPDLLGLSISPPRSSAEAQQANRFNLSRGNSSQDVHEQAAQTLSPTKPSFPTAHGPDHSSNKESAPSTPAQRPTAFRSVTQAVGRISLDLPRLAWQSPGADGRRRRFSLSMAGRRGSGTDDGGENDEEGDLGYAAVGEREGSRRKVIVERLEMVKTRRPFFTWC